MHTIGPCVDILLDRKVTLKFKLQLNFSTKIIHKLYLVQFEPGETLLSKFQRIYEKSRKSPLSAIFMGIIYHGHTQVKC